MTANRVLTATIGLLLVAEAAAQQPSVVPDTSYHPTVAHPAFDHGTGPKVHLDAAHFNPEDLVGFYEPLAELLQADGFRVTRSDGALAAGSLTTADVLVIANALPAPTQEAADTLGSAFTPDEIDALLAWIEDGGALLLFVDHRPFPRAAAELGARIGLEMLDGYALDYEVWDPIVFSRRRRTLASHPVTDGLGGDDRVDSVATFYGHAFRAADSAWAPLMIFGSEIESMHPDGLWGIGDQTVRIPVGGWWQGAARSLGRGRVVVFGETGMAVAQRVGARSHPRGMNSPVGAQNARLILNAARWLVGVLPER